MKHSEGFEKLCDDAKTRVREITVADVKRKQDAGEQFHFIDVREDNEWAQDHAAGALHLGRGIIERDIEKTVPDKDAEIVLYCGGGFRSALAADNLQKMGYTNVLSMAGGIKARSWSATRIAQRINQIKRGEPDVIRLSPFCCRAVGDRFSPCPSIPQLEDRDFD
jgi:rhodanese-related sulfurtransferase